MEQNIYELSDKLNFIMNVKESDKDRFKNIISWAGEMMDLTIKERMVKEIYPRKGEIWTCNMGENVGCELNKIRPVLIVSNDKGNRNSPIVTVDPISNGEEMLPTHVKLHVDSFAYTEKSITGTVKSEQMKALSKARLGRKIGEVTPETMVKVELSILISLGMIGELAKA
ncbi:hypothetical protein CVD28_04085 [Bacillus sp. M6-12]|uniref:type II toxin-antitoxin system PemK/MazF family toxin n=1 Tax=Bacillus sp. M6-12 TaxID=2054166 RepID=UPI000C77A1EF|nr:type II toxin-antitoxin system PemK/MazF family toxin [Bacillus sp. M6-12]PLS19604.1 hypothetical protein CVD28_04085 [Bacillus sp. M6-12]